MARVALTPECISAAVLVDSQMLGDVGISEVVDELHLRTAALNNGDLTRTEGMLLAQTHTLDGLLATRALNAQQRDSPEPYMRLALKTQNQARHALQTLAELKSHWLLSQHSMIRV